MWQWMALGAVVVALCCVVVAVSVVARARQGSIVTVPAPAPLGGAAEANYRQLAANLPQTSVLVVDLDLRYVLAEGEGRFDGVDSTRAGRDLVGQLAYDVVVPAVWEVTGPHYRSALAGEVSEFDAPGGVGGEPVHVRTLPLWGQDGVVTGAVIITERVAEQRQAFAALHAAQAFNEGVLAASADLMVVFDLSSGAWEWTSRSVWEALGWSIDARLAADPSAIMRQVVDEDAAAVGAAWTKLASLGPEESLAIRFRLQGPDGTRRWISCRAIPFGRAEDGTGHRALAAVRDVTDLVEIEQRLQHAALHDPLTGLPNRARLMELVASATKLLDEDAGDLALLFCDLDGFKHINDTYGHGAGDAVLIEVARRLQKSLRDGDSVARVGGDEFVVVLGPSRSSQPDLGQVADPGPRFRALAERIQNQVSRPIDYDGHGLHVSVSIGIAPAGCGSTAAEALSNADAAMYRAKKMGRGRIEVFDRSLELAREARLHAEATLVDALTPSSLGMARLSVEYQPVFDVELSRLVAFEALARLTDQNGRPIAPNEFIPVAEDIGLIHLLDQRVLEIALEALREWTSNNPEALPVKMAVNVSASQALSVNLADQIRTALLRHDVAPSSLVIEVTETMLLDLGTSILEQLRQLHDLGVAIAIDDFGTGYASLQYLTTLPVDVIKVDRCFMVGLGTDPTSTAIIRAVAALALDLGLVCILEGIETEEQLAELPRGVLGQGFLLGKPHPTLRGAYRPPQGGLAGR